MVRSSFPPAVLSTTPEHEQLVEEVARLRRWVKVSGALCAAALIACGVLASLLLRSGLGAGLTTTLDVANDSSPAAPADEPLSADTTQGVRVSSKQKGVTLLVDGRERGTLPLTVDDLAAGKHELRFEASKHKPLVKHVSLAAGELLELGDVSLTPAKVSLVIHLPSDGTTVSLAKKGEPAEVLSGTFPKTLELAPGRYEVFAARRGQTWSRPLDLSLERPRRELTIGLR
jgi:hypothetical protein